MVRVALEAKAALYDKLHRGDGLVSSDDEEDEELGPRYMVDFQRKIYEEVQWNSLMDGCSVIGVDLLKNILSGTYTIYMYNVQVYTCVVSFPFLLTVSF